MICYTAIVVLLVVQVIPQGQGLECSINNVTCIFDLVIEPKLTMMYNSKRVLPRNGGLYYNDDPSKALLDEETASKVLTADGVYAQLVIAINGEFPGPELIMYEGQEIEVYVSNQLHTDSVTVHFHGMHQKGTPWFDGVAYVTQCPILPGARFRYKFKASPAGTHWYHAHIGDQRSMGLYGPFIVKKRSPPTFIIDEHIMILQDWNHDMDPETAYLKMLFGIYDCDERSNPPCTPYNITNSVDGAQFSRFEFHTGLVNGKGRYHYSTSPNDHNNAPLMKYAVEQGKTYRFRVISAATLYPFRIYIARHRLTIVTSDGGELKKLPVDSFVIQSGERYDFYLEANQSPSYDYIIVAESLEIGKEKQHVAEAILQYNPISSGNKPNYTDERTCTRDDPCIVFNCPFRYYPANSYRNCTTYNSASGIEEGNEVERGKILNTPDVKEFFLNFAFPGVLDNTPGSVNGRQFVSPNVAALTQPKDVGPACSEITCGADKLCSCAYSIDINHGDVVELVLLNMGNGSGWSHPVHMHGHSFYVLAYGFPQYDVNTGRVLTQNENIECEDNYCNVAKWRGRGQAKPPILASNRIPPLKDTVIVPTGGYVQVRFLADNPGVWFLHCHIDLHNTNGMAMMVNESFPVYSKTAVPEDFPRCGDYTGTFPTISANPPVPGGNHIGTTAATSSGKEAGMRSVVSLSPLFLWICTALEF